MNFLSWWNGSEWEMKEITLSPRQDEQSSKQYWESESERIKTENPNIGNAFIIT